MLKVIRALQTARETKTTTKQKFYAPRVGAHERGLPKTGSSFCKTPDNLLK
jgi:hypothetical protein